MVALFILLIVAAVVLGVLGVLLKGLFYLLIIGIVVFVLDIGISVLRLSKRRSHVRGGRRSLR